MKKNFNHLEPEPINSADLFSGVLVQLKKVLENHLYDLNKIINKFLEYNKCIEKKICLDCNINNQ
jgi:hypothetical protein